MRRGIVIAALLLLTGCAVGRVTPSEMHGFALGGGAKLERCTSDAPIDDPESIRWTIIRGGYIRSAVATSPPTTTCAAITGGSLSSGAWDVLGAALSALAAYFTAGAAGVL